MNSLKERFGSGQASRLRRLTRARVCTCSTSPRSACVRRLLSFSRLAARPVCTFPSCAIWKIACEKNSISLQHQSESSNDISQSEGSEVCRKPEEQALEYRLQSGSSLLPKAQLKSVP